jgi:hypothetical protein
MDDDVDAFKEHRFIEDFKPEAPLTVRDRFYVGLAARVFRLLGQEAHAHRCGGLAVPRNFPVNILVIRGWRASGQENRSDEKRCALDHRL